MNDRDELTLTINNLLVEFSILRIGVMEISTWPALKPELSKRLLERTGEIERELLTLIDQEQDQRKN